MLHKTGKCLLHLLINYDDINENIHLFSSTLRHIYNIIPNFECDSNIYCKIGHKIVENETNLDIVLHRSLNVLKCLTQPISANNSKKLCSVSDRARLLGSILHHYDENLCKIYSHSIGDTSSKHSLYNLRHDLQRELILKIHKHYNVTDILTLDVFVGTSYHKKNQSKTNFHSHSQSQNVSRNTNASFNSNKK